MKIEWIRVTKDLDGRVKVFVEAQGKQMCVIDDNHDIIDHSVKFNWIEENPQNWEEIAGVK